MINAIVVQHCQSEHHVNGLTGGWTDTPLTELGRQQAQCVANRLKENIEIEKYILYSSDLQRAYQTAQVIGEVLHKQISVDKSLREINHGSGTGKTKKWFDEHCTPLPQHGRIDHRMLPDAETSREHFIRIAEYLDSIKKQNVQNVIIVTHGGAVPHIMCWWLGIPIEVQDSFYTAGNASGVTILSRDKRINAPILICFNDLSHLVQFEKKPA
jgi:broad specificity phosphatase PhoE